MEDVVSNPIGTVLGAVVLIGFLYFIYTRIRASRNKSTSTGGSTGTGTKTHHK